MKKVGLWFYRNDGGAVTEKILAEKLRKKGYEVIDDFDMRKCYILDGNVYTETGYNLSQLDVFYHMNADEQTEYQRDVLKVLSMSDVKVFNDYNSFNNAQDKMVANYLLRKAGLRVAPSLFMSANFNMDVMKKLFEEWGTILIKPRKGHGGKGILKFNNFESFYDFNLATKDFYKSYYIEKMIPFDTHDYRVEIFDGEVIGGYSREKVHSFKSNISSGGIMLDVPVENEQVQIALKAAKALNITTTIIDMVRSTEDGEIYIIEINPMMGIFLESAMRSGEKIPVQEQLPEQFCYDYKKVDAIIKHIDKLCNQSN